MIAEINVLKKKDFETSKFRTIRSMKNLKQDEFYKISALQKWKKLGMTEDVDVMAELFLEMSS